MWQFLWDIVTSDYYHSLFSCMQASGEWLYALITREYSDLQNSGIPFCAHTVHHACSSYGALVDFVATDGIRNIILEILTLCTL